MPKARARGKAPARVVGIGASAGGLDALRQLVASLPRDTGLAFVILQHLPPSHVAQLAELLARATELPVVEAKPGARLRADTIHVVSPQTCVLLQRGALMLETK